MLRWFAIVLLILTACLQAYGSISVKWMCEGRVCSTDPLHCCCSNPDNKHRDSFCASEHSNGPDGYECRCKCRAHVSCDKSFTDSTLSKVAVPAPTLLNPVAFTATMHDLVLTVRLPEVKRLAKPPPKVHWEDFKLDRTQLRGPPL